MITTTIVILAVALAIMCCGITHNVIMSYGTGGGSVVGNLAVTGDTELNADVTLEASSTDINLDLDFAKANIQSCVLYCSAACTVETNSGSAPDDTIALVAGQPTICQNNTEALALFSEDVTSLYLTCSAGGTFSIRLLLDQTP